MSASKLFIGPAQRGRRAITQAGLLAAAIFAGMLAPLATSDAAAAGFTEQGVDILGGFGMNARSCSFADIDNDGDQDLVVIGGYTTSGRVQGRPAPHQQHHRHRREDLHPQRHRHPRGPRARRHRFLEQRLGRLRRRRLSRSLRRLYQRRLRRPRRSLPQQRRRHLLQRHRHHRQRTGLPPERRLGRCQQRRQTRSFRRHGRPRRPRDLPAKSHRHLHTRRPGRRPLAHLRAQRHAHPPRQGLWPRHRRPRQRRRHGRLHLHLPRRRQHPRHLFPQRVHHQRHARLQRYHRLQRHPKPAEQLRHRVRRLRRRRRSRPLQHRRRRRTHAHLPQRRQRRLHRRRHPQRTPAPHLARHRHQRLPGGRLRQRWRPRSLLPRPPQPHSATTTDTARTLYRNDGNWKFRDVTAEVGLLEDSLGSYDSAWADFDLDGDMDLLRNHRLPRTRAFLRQRFQHQRQSLDPHPPPRIPGQRKPIGAQLYATIHKGTPQERRIRRDWNTSAAAFHQSQIPVHFGLGQAAVIDELHIVWPNKKTATLRNVSANQYLDVYYDTNNFWTAY